MTDGGNYLWAYRGNDGLIAVFTCWGMNAPGKILRAICDAFDVEVVSDYEPQSFGFETQEAMDAAMEKSSAEHRDSFYEQVIHYVRGDVHDLRPGTVGMRQAGIAKGLIAEDSDLALPGNKDRLLQAIDAMDDRDHAVKITLTPEEVAVVRMQQRMKTTCPRHERRRNTRTAATRPAGPITRGHKGCAQETILQSRIAVGIAHPEPTRGEFGAGVAAMRPAPTCDTSTGTPRPTREAKVVWPRRDQVIEVSGGRTIRFEPPGG